jgi:hypothetical protein
MGDIAAEVTNHLDCIKKLLKSIRNPPVADISENVAASLAAPWLEQCRSSLLAKILLNAGCQRRDPSSLANSFIASARVPASPAGRRCPLGHIACGNDTSSDKNQKEKSHFKTPDHSNLL